ncbi:hypothetical protein [Streptomyces lavendulocolor]|uniref:hypothetical protein n=1 Tax=Streptomyces lavendulocolor TaxID=67316 RepID=UPI003C2F67A8
MWATLRGSWFGKPALWWLPDGRTALSQRLGALLANAAAPALIAAGPGLCGHTTACDRYTSTTAELEVEVASGTTRHAG